MQVVIPPTYHTPQPLLTPLITNLSPRPTPQVIANTAEKKIIITITRNAPLQAKPQKAGVCQNLHGCVFACVQSWGNLGVESSQASLCPYFRSTCTTAESQRHKHTQTQTQTQTQIGSHRALRLLCSICTSLPRQESSTLLCYICLFSRC